MSKTSAQLEREIAEALPSRYRLTVAGPTGRYSESHFTGTKAQALAEAQRRLAEGATHVRVESGFDSLLGEGKFVASLP